MIRRDGGDQQQIDFFGRDPGIRQGGPGGLIAEISRRFAGPGVMPLQDARPSNNPIAITTERVQIFVGDPVPGYVRTGPGDADIHHGSHAAPPVVRRTTDFIGGVSAIHGSGGVALLHR